MSDVTLRSELIRSQKAAVPLPTRSASGEAYVRSGATGSGEDLLVLRWTAADLARERAAGARVLGGFGVRAGMRVANTLAGALVSPGSLLLGDVVEEIGGLDVPLGFTANEAAAKAAWELMDRVQPEILVVDGVSAGPLFAAAPHQPRSWLLGVVWLRTGSNAERIEVPPSLGFSGWQRGWLAVAEVSSFVAAECARGNYHVDLGVEAEVVAVQLVLSAPASATAPQRYASGIRASQLPSCACGLAGMSLDLA